MSKNGPHDRGPPPHVVSSPEMKSWSALIWSSQILAWWWSAPRSWSSTLTMSSSLLMSSSSGEPIHAGNGGRAHKRQCFKRGAARHPLTA